LDERKIREFWIHFRLCHHIIPWCRRANDFPIQDAPPLVLEMKTGPDSKISRVKKNKLDAQLILSIFRQPLHVSGVSMPINWYLFFLDDCPTRTTDSHLKRTISNICCIHTFVPPDDGPRHSRNM